MPPPYDYVIITTNAIETNSTKLAAFVAHKQVQGHSVLVVTEDDYGGLTGQAPNGTAEKIRKWLIDHYASYGIEYVLLIGNPDPDDPSSGSDSVGDVPMKMCWPRRGDTDPDSPTDAFYADLTGDWDVDGDGYYGEWADYTTAGGVDFAPEVWVGRIPVYSAAYATLDNILQKLMDYATEPVGETGWREHNLFPMSFTEPGYDGAPLAEQMRNDYLTSRSMPSWRQYQQGNGVCSADDSIYTSDQELLGGTVVRDRWGANDYGIVTWSGHGSATSALVGYGGCWDGTLFGNWQTSSLDDDHPSFTYQCSCTNAYPENTNNLAYAILKEGGIGTVSATRVSWYNAGVGYGDFDGSSTNSGIGYEYVDRLSDKLNPSPAGKALFEAKLAVVTDIGTRNTRLMNQYDFNLYGDPSVSLRGCQCTDKYIYDDTTTYSFEDISSTGTNLNLDDDECTQVNLTFWFTFYGRSYNTVNVCSNGTVHFIDKYLGLSNRAIPEENGYSVPTFIAPLWDDLNPSAGGAVYWQVKNSGSPFYLSRLIIQWHQVPRYPNIGAATFQVILYDSIIWPIPDSIKFQYQDVDFGDPTYDYGASATVGVQGHPCLGSEYSYNSPALSNGLAIALTPVNDEPARTDFDSYGQEDLLWRHTTGMLYMWLCEDFSVKAHGSLGGTGTDWQIKGIGDVDGDGKSDIVWQHTSGAIYVWLCDGLTIKSHGSLGSAGAGWQIKELGDLDGDGKSDIVWQHTSGTVYVWLCDGISIKSHGSLGSAGAGWQIKEAGDVDGDGKADIVWRHTSGTVYVWLCDGISIKSHGELGGAGTDWQIQEVGDVDGDGKLDIVWQHTSGTVYAWCCDGISIKSSGVLGEGGTGWQIREVGDIDGDGCADIVWRHTSGTVYVWCCDGISIKSHGVLGGASADWQMISS